MQEEEIRDFEKYITTVFILLILSANGILSIKLIASAQSFLVNQTQFVLAALVVADILLALFTIGVSALKRYTVLTLSCATTTTAETYGVYNSFVYAIALMGLGIELALRRKLQTGDRLRMVTATAAYALGPFLLGVLVVVPLVYADYDWDGCGYKDTFARTYVLLRYKATIFLGIVAPVVLALVVSVVLMFVNLPPPTASPPRCPGETAIRLDKTLETVFEDGHQDSQAAGATTELITETSVAKPAAPPSSTIEKPDASRSNNGGQHDDHDPLLSSRPHDDALHEESVKRRKKMAGDRKGLLVATIVTFVCHIAYAIFMVSYAYNPHAERLSYVTHVAVTNFFYWLLMLRPVITPLVWCLFG